MAVQRDYVSDDLDFDVEAAPTAATTAPSTVETGWGAADKQLAPSGEGFPVDLRLSEDFQIIKFIDTNGPFAVYSQHFLQQKTEGKRSFVCLGDNCPLCVKLRHRPEKKTAFSVVNLTSGEPMRQVLTATPRLYKTLHAAEFSPQGPLTKNYWAINRTGKLQQTVYNLMPVKARDLAEDWGVDPEQIEPKIASFAPFDRSIIKNSTFAELLDLAELYA